jgi:prohibitin 2
MAAAGPKISPAAVGGLARLLIGGGLAVYGATNSLFNVEGGHRAIVFNRLIGIKDEVSVLCMLQCSRGVCMAEQQQQ